MKKFYQVFSGLAVAMLLALGSMQASAGLDFRFSFLSESPFYVGEVSGTIFGLTEPAAAPGPGTGSVASSVQIDAIPTIIPTALIFPATAPLTLVNAFSVAAADGGGFEIDSFSFFGFSANGDVLCLFDNFNCLGSNDVSYQAGLAVVETQRLAGGNSLESIAVPAPAPLALLAFGMLVLIRQRRTRA